MGRNPYEYGDMIAQEQLEAHQKRDAWMVTYGPYTVFVSEGGVGTSWRRQKRWPVVLAASMDSDLAYMILYNPFLRRCFGGRCKL